MPVKTRQPPSVPLQTSATVELELDVDDIGHERSLDASAQPAERERNHRLTQLDRNADARPEDSNLQPDRYER
jgi:hypothetical protein